MLTPHGQSYAASVPLHFSRAVFGRWLLILLGGRPRVPLLTFCIFPRGRPNGPGERRWTGSSPQTLLREAPAVLRLCLRDVRAHVPLHNPVASRNPVSRSLATRAFGCCS